jgi:hypothetical protein
MRRDEHDSFSFQVFDILTTFKPSSGFKAAGVLDHPNLKGNPKPNPSRHRAVETTCVTHCRTRFRHGIATARAGTSARGKVAHGTHRALEVVGPCPGRIPPRDAGSSARARATTTGASRADDN